MNHMRQNPLRIFYAAGPGDVVGTFRHWKVGRDDPYQVAVTYSSLFYDTVAAIGATALVVSSCPRADAEQTEQIRVEQRALPLHNATGLRYHLRQVLAGLILVRQAVRWKADVAVVVTGSSHWFVLGLLPWLGVAVVPSLHSLLWAPRRAQPPAARLLRWLEGRFFARRPVAILSLSREITAQVEQATRGRHPPIVPFVPAYRQDAFAQVGPPPPGRRPFRVFYAGRIETSKGVYDLLETAALLRREGRQDIEFDLAGEGSQLEPLRHRATEMGLAGQFRCHGHCTKPQMAELFSGSHVLVTPTRSELVEGFNKVVVEAVLAGRPVISSSACPALHSVREGAMEVPPDDARALAEAIARLMDDAELYRSKCEGASQAAEVFYDPARNWAAALREALRLAAPPSSGAQDATEPAPPTALPAVGAPEGQERTL